MSQNLQNFIKFQKFQLENLVDLKNAAKRIFSWKNRSRYSRKRATFCRNFVKNWQLPPRGRSPEAAARLGRPLVLAEVRGREGRAGEARWAAAPRFGRT